MADQGDSNDPLLNKLDNLMQRGHARQSHDPPPRLTDTVPDVRDSDIPVLTDAVETPSAPAPEKKVEDPAEARKLITSRLVTVVDDEIGKLSKELSGHEARLAVLHRSLRFALPELVRLRWEEIPETDAQPGDAEDSDSGE
jgi:hypothetical protein